MTFFNLNNLIYIYLAICFLLLGYNAVYSLSDERNLRIKKKRVGKWFQFLQRDFKREKEGVPSLLSLKKYRKKLENINELIAFENAVEAYKMEEPSNTFHQYMLKHRGIFQDLSLKYRKKDSMTKAYYAYCMEVFRPCDEKEYDLLLEILLTYLNGSTIYCRENVLKALYSFGNVQAVVNAFQYLNDFHYFHHNKLLSDGLMSFQGDQHQLAIELWNNHASWDENIVVSIIQFISSFDQSFRKEFYECLKEDTLHPEIHFALIRYFRKHYYAPVKSLLLKLIKENKTKNINYLVVAIATLEVYPSKETYQVIKEELKNPNWYVRRNAASALIKLNISEEEIEEILRGEDRYASEMLTYMLNNNENYKRKECDKVS